MTVVIAELPLRGGGGEPVDLRRTLASHGLGLLPSNKLDTETWTLETTLSTGDGATRTVCLSGGAERVTIASEGGGIPPQEAQQLTSQCRHLLRLDQDLSRFYALAARDPHLSWVTAGAGRMLRSATVFEDVIKTICTTNCAWSATVRMVTAIVDNLGEPGPGNKRAFPGPVAMADAGEEFYRDIARSGYRGAFIRSLAREVAEGRLDLEELNDPELPDLEAQARLLALPGVGPYAAAHIMLTSLGRYGPLTLDSWTRPTYARLTGRRAADLTIERRFRRYREYSGLAFWLFLTRDWVAE
jgi:N-glycosylase/DNA lyase